jgi:hypothetical protein
MRHARKDFNVSATASRSGLVNGLIEGHRAGDAFRLELHNPRTPVPHWFVVAIEVLGHEYLVRGGP